MDDMQFAMDTLMEGRAVIAKLNVQTGMLVFLKHPDEWVPLRTPISAKTYYEMELAHGVLVPEEYSRVKSVLDLSMLRTKCEAREGGSVTNFRRKFGEEVCWTKMILSIPSSYGPESPEVVMCLRKLTSQEADVEDAYRTIRDHIQKMVKIDYSTGQYQILRAAESEDFLRRWRLKDYRLEEENFVHPDDLEEFREATDPERVVAYFAAGNLERSVYYRRKTGSLYLWVKLIFRPAAEYREDHPVLIYSIIDVSTSLTNYFLNQGKKSFLKQYQENAEQVDTYYQNVLQVLAFFTQTYMDFYVVDLKKDQYIKYKISRSLLNGFLPYVGCYSEMSAKSLNSMLTPQEAERLRKFTDPAVLREVLLDKLSFEYEFVMPDGKSCKTIITRLESEEGIPTKVLCRTVVMPRENQLKVKTFGNFEVFDASGRPIAFSKKKSQQLLAYLIDRRGFPVSTADIVMDVLEKPMDDLNAKKYVSTLFRAAEKDLEKAGYTGILIKEWNSLRVDVDALDCDYYHLMDGDVSYWTSYRNEYMKEYSWAEETNAELLRMGQ